MHVTGASELITVGCDDVIKAIDPSLLISTTELFVRHIVEHPFSAPEKCGDKPRPSLAKRLRQIIMRIPVWKATMIYDVLVIIVVLNALATFSLWQKVATKRNRGPKLNKKAAAGLWRSDPIIPKNDPPRTAGAEFSSLADESDRRFFADFKDFADVINWWFAEEAIASRFRLQDLPAGDLSLNVDFSDGPRLGRSFAIYHNQTRVGRLEVSPAYKYSDRNPVVHTSIEIGWVRFLSLDDLATFLDVIAWYLVSADAQSEEYRQARLTTLDALVRTLWDDYRVSEYDNPDDERWGELNVSFRGTALFYFDRRDAPARSMSR